MRSSTADWQCSTGSDDGSNSVAPRALTISTTALFPFPCANANGNGFLTITSLEFTVSGFYKRKHEAAKCANRRIKPINGPVACQLSNELFARFWVAISIVSISAHLQTLGMKHSLHFVSGSPHNTTLFAIGTI